MKPGRDPTVSEWLDRQAPETFYLTTTGLAELLVGIELLPAGKRKMGFARALDAFIIERFGSRILAFDEAAARVYATLVARARANGQALGVADGQIGSIAAVNGFAVATRDTAPFAAAGIPVINPWQGES